MHYLKDYDLAMPSIRYGKTRQETTIEEQTEIFDRIPQNLCHPNNLRFTIYFVYRFQGFLI